VEQISGKVERVKGSGFTLAGRDGWLNLSKFAEGVTVPAVGDVVAVEIDGKGFVRQITNATPHGPPVSTNGHSAPADRETAINRRAVLNTATAILGGGTGFAIDPAEVVKLAARLECWVRRPG
jgi:hypothetical protein